MTIIKKIDVNNYLSSRKRKGIHLYRPPTQPNLIELSGAPSAQADSYASNIIEATSNRSSLSKVDPLQTETRLARDPIPVPTKSESAQE